jgi:hypothetical protein
MDSLFDSLSAAVTDALPWLEGDDPEEQEAHVHTRQARWEVLAAEGGGDALRASHFGGAPYDEDDTGEGDAGPEPAVLPPRPLPVDADARLARQKAALRGPSPSPGSPFAVPRQPSAASTPTGSSWASRPPPGSPAARAECVLLFFSPLRRRSAYTHSRLHTGSPSSTGALVCLLSSGARCLRCSSCPRTGQPWSACSYRKTAWNRTACTCTCLPCVL